MTRPVTAVSGALELLVPPFERSIGDWEEIIRRAEVTDRGSGRRLVTRRRAIALALLFSVLVVLFATPAFGLLRDLIGRTNVSFTGKAAPLEVKRQFFDLSLGAPPGMAPEAIASEARRVAVFHTFGRAHILYVAPTRQGGLRDLHGVFRRLSRDADTTEDVRAHPGSRQPVSARHYVAGIRRPASPHDGGRWDILAPNAASLTVEYEDHSTTAIPFVFVSKPINAGFFLYEIPRGHERPGTRSRQSAFETAMAL